MSSDKPSNPKIIDIKQIGKQIKLKWLVEDNGQDDLTQLNIEISRNFSADILFYEYYAS